jgi:hypothetical protein
MKLLAFEDCGPLSRDEAIVIILVAGLMLYLFVRQTTKRIETALEAIEIGR